MKTQINFAIIFIIPIYVLMAIMKKRMNLKISLYTMLQIFSISIFDKTPLLQLLKNTSYKNQIAIDVKQLKLFD
jgi:hypothetical protein